MQDMVGGDNNRTLVKYQRADIFVFVGVIGNLYRTAAHK